MYTLQFGKNTTLAAQMTAAEVTSGTLASAVFTDFSSDYLVIDYDVPSKREVIKCNISGTAISSITRGQEGTSAVQHEIGAKIGYNFVPSHYSSLNRLWASVYLTGMTLTAGSGTSTLVSNPAYTVTKIGQNPAGFSSVKSVWKSMGGFYFEAPRTGKYKLRYVGSQKITGTTGPYAMIYSLSMTTTLPTQNVDGTHDDGVGIRVFAATTAGPSYADAFTVANEIIVDLTAGTTYYFVTLANWTSAAGTTPVDVSTGDQGASQGTTLSIEELN